MRIIHFQKILFVFLSFCLISGCAQKEFSTRSTPETHSKKIRRIESTTQTLLDLKQEEIEFLSNRYTTDVFDKLEDAINNPNSDHSGFVGDLVLRFLGNHKGEMELLEDFAFIEEIDPYYLLEKRERIWRAKKGTITDGATIPKELWSLVGSPYTDNYLVAAVIHDYYCENREYSSSATHEIFYKAMREANVSEEKALLFYYAVLAFGDRWSAPVIVNGEVKQPAEEEPNRDFDLDEVKIIKKYIDDGKLSYLDIPILAEVLNNPKSIVTAPATLAYAYSSKFHLEFNRYLGLQ